MTISKPTVPIVPDELPPELAAWGVCDQFITWRLVFVPGKPDMWTKEPVGSIHDDATSWADAVALCRAGTRGAEGVGYVFDVDDPHWFIDIDGCREKREDGSFGPWDQRSLDILALFPGCAVEVSVSQTGLHIFGAWADPIPHRKKRAHLEFYTEKRFVANTFWLTEGGRSDTVADGPIREFMKTYDFEKTAPAAVVGSNGVSTVWDTTAPDARTDAEVLQLMGQEAPEKGVTTLQILEGEWETLADRFPPKSDKQDFGVSEAVYAVLGRFYRYSDGNPVQMRRMFEACPLGAGYDAGKAGRSIESLLKGRGPFYSDKRTPEQVFGAPAAMPAGMNGTAVGAPGVPDAGSDEFGVEAADYIEPDHQANSLIEGVLDRGTLACVLGKPGSSKTFQALDLGMCVARGVPWFGHRVPQAGPVVYIAAEGRRGIRKRISAYIQRHGIRGQGVPFFLIPRQIKLIDNGPQLERLRDRIRELGDVKLIFFDTLSMSIAGGAENAPEVMTAAMEAAQWLTNELGATVVLVHHLGKDEKRGARGHSSLFGALDTELTVEAEGDEFVIRATKQRDLELGVEHRTRLEVVGLGPDSEGREITSCVVVEALYTQAVNAGPKMNQTEREIHKIYTGLLATEPIAVPESIIIELEASDPRGRTVGPRIGLELSRVKDAYFRRYEEKADSRADSKGTCGRTWRRGVKYLQDRDSINLFGGFIWDDTPPGGQLVATVRPTVRPELSAPATLSGVGRTGGHLPIGGVPLSALPPMPKI